MKIIEKQGKDVHEILSQFKSEYNLNETDFTYEIIQESKKGILGLIGNKNAIVQFKIDNLTEEISDYLRELTIYSQVTIGKIDIKQDEKYIYVELNEVSDPGFFIGKDGKFLQSLQYLLNQSFSQRDSQKRAIILDIEGYKERQEQNIIKRVKHLAEQAIKSKRNITLEPMPSAQRRIVHQTVQDIEDIKTMTIGEGSHKRIILSPAKVNKVGARKFYRQDKVKEDNIVKE